MAAGTKTGGPAPRIMPPRITALRSLLPYLRPYRGRVVLAAVALLLAAGLVLGLGQGVRHLVDEGFAAGDAAALDRTALLLFGVVALAHHPAAFMGLLLLFMGIATAYPQFQDRLILREGLLVAFFLAGLVVLGGQQQWWLEPLLHSMNETTVYFGATALTAITDNAALTYLGSQVEGLSEPFKQALVAGAVTGGGLTVIANAPNPAGFAILRGHFEDGAISPLGLFAAALPPTIVAILAFRLL